MGKFYQALEKSKHQGESQSSSDILKSAADPAGDLTVVKHPESPAAEYFRFLRSQIIYPAKGKPPRTILVTSAISGDGKTFVATNLAACIALGVTEHVLFLDCDLRNPAAHKIFGIEQKCAGLSSYLTNKSNLTGLLYKTGIPKLAILPGGNTIDNPSELLSSEKMQCLISEVRDRYPDRFVILDTTPLELAPETSVLAHKVDAALMVIQYGKTPRRLAKSGIEKIGKEKLLGIVFNRHEEPIKDYNRYRYGYGYGKKKSDKRQRAWRKAQG